MQNYTFRLKPDHDLFDSIEELARERHIEAECLLGIIPSTLPEIPPDF